MTQDHQQAQAAASIPSIKNGDPSSQLSQESARSSYRRLHYMYGAVTQIELNGFLEGNSVDTEERKREIKATWRGAADLFQTIVSSEAGLPDTVTTRPIAEGPD
jgi:hypothetical protein